MRTTVLLAAPEGWGSAIARVVSGADDLELARRCADLAELLATAAAGLGQVAVVSSRLPGLDRTAVAELGRCGVRVVGTLAPRAQAEQGDAPEQVVDGPDGSEGSDGSATDAARALRALGVGVVLPCDATAECWRAALRGPDVPERPTPLAALADALDVPPDRRPAEAPVDPRPTGPPGTVVAVWGPTGAPGRSTVALAIASEVAHLGGTALLVDADPYGGVQAQLLAVPDDAPGLVGAVRRADRGDLDVAALAACGHRVAPGLTLLAGISRADRWPELRPDPLADVLLLARRTADLVVVDCGFALEDDEELSYDTAAPRRNAATLTALGCADRLVVVGAGEPVGLVRLVRGLEELETVRCPGRRTVVVNRVRAGAVGAEPERTLGAALGRFTGLRDLHFVPDDRDALDRAVLRGTTLVECAPRSPARLALAGLAAEVAARPSVGVAHPAPSTRPGPTAKSTDDNDRSP